MNVIFSGPGERERDRDSELDSDSGLREERNEKCLKIQLKYTYRKNINRNKKKILG